MSAKLRLPSFGFKSWILSLTDFFPLFKRSNLPAEGERDLSPKRPFPTEAKPETTSELRLGLGGDSSWLSWLSGKMGLLSKRLD